MKAFATATHSLINNKIHRKFNFTFAFGFRKINYSPRELLSKSIVVPNSAIKAFLSITSLIP